MSQLDWWVLLLTIGSIVSYGIWKSRNQSGLSSYFLANREIPWYQVGLSVMATQASAITFLSAPGQAYSDGMRFIQFYLGLPLAMIILCMAFVPRFINMGVVTAYAYLEERFDVKTRKLTSFLFLLQRGLSTGITVYAPSLVLATLLEWPVSQTCLIIGCLVIIYTVYGGTKAVSFTHMLQMIVIFSGLLVAGILAVNKLPNEIGFLEALEIGGFSGKMNVLDTSLDWDNRYNLWSGLVGGFFLQLSYFGTDQSQVGRYLTAKSVGESRLGLIMNGLLKIPMQFFILLIGVLVFAFYQFHPAPLSFNIQEINQLKQAGMHREVHELQKKSESLSQQKRLATLQWIEIKKHQNSPLALVENEIKTIETRQKELKKDFNSLVIRLNPNAETNDSNYVFLRFVMDNYPKGLIGLLIAIIFLASMGSTASGLNALASTTVVDIIPQNIPLLKGMGDLLLSRIFTLIWGVFCMVVAVYASRLGNLIEAVNVLGSLFYGTILGIFLTAFFIKEVTGNAVFFAALITEAIILIVWQMEGLAFLWLNVCGGLMVPFLGWMISQTFRNKQSETKERK